MTLVKAKIINTENDNALTNTITVLYNPPSLKVYSSNTYADVKTPGGSMEKQQYIKNNSDILTVELFFDITRKPLDPNNPAKKYADVRELVNPVLELARVPKGKKEPPKLKFAWGEFSFDCVIISITHTYDYFSMSGNALRATLNVQFRRVDPKKAAPANAAQGAVKKEVIKNGQDITCFCDNPKNWRPTAEANGIDNVQLVGSGAMEGEELMCVDSSLAKSG